MVLPRMPAMTALRVEVFMYGLSFFIFTKAVVIGRTGL
jgi:hypothetical protein